MYETSVNTQVSSIRSSMVLQRVLDQKDVQKTTWYRTPPTPLFGDVPSQLERLTEELEVQPIPKTQIIMISMSTLDPKSAETIVNAVADQYLAMSTQRLTKQGDQRFDTLTRMQDDMQRQISRLVQNKSELADKLGTDTPSELRTRFTLYREELDKELDALRRATAMREWELKELQARNKSSGATSQPGQNDPSSAFVGDTEWRQLKLGLETARLNLQNGSEMFGESNPKYKELAAAVTHAEKLVKEREAQLGMQPGLSAYGVGANKDGHGSPASQSELEQAIAHLKAEEQELKRSLEKQKKQIADANEVARQLAATEDELARLRASQHEVVTRREQLAVEEKAPGRISILARAIAASRPTKDRRIAFIILAFGAAIFLGGALGYGRDMLDPSIHEIHDVITHVRAPFLGLLPLVSSPLASREKGPPQAVLRECVRHIRTALLQRLDTRQGCAIVVTSSGPSVGKTTSAVLLARSLGELGKRVLLVDADMRRRTLSRLYARETGCCLRSLLNGNAAEDVTPHRLPHSTCELVSAGTTTEDGDPELLANGARVGSCRRGRPR
jgi:succinoglycan biosynthesis transport protein ExoP